MSEESRRNSLLVKLPEVSPEQLARLHELEKETTVLFSNKKESNQPKTVKFFKIIKAEYRRPNNVDWPDHYIVDVEFKLDIRDTDYHFEEKSGKPVGPIFSTTLQRVLDIVDILPQPTAAELEGLEDASFGFRKEKQLPKKPDSAGEGPAL